MAFDDEQIFARLTPIFQEVFDNDDVRPHPAMTAHEVDEWDSLTHIQLVVAIEQAFKVKFTIGELSTLENVGQMVDLLKSKLPA